MTKQFFLKKMDVLLSVYPHSNVEQIADLYYELVEDMDEDTFDAMIKEILFNESFFPTLRVWKNYVTKFIYHKKYEIMYEAVCDKCGKAFIVSKVQFDRMKAGIIHENCNGIIRAINKIKLTWKE